MLEVIHTWIQEYFEGFFNIARSDLHENFTTNVSVDKKVPVKFGKSSGSGLWI